MGCGGKSDRAGSNDGDSFWVTHLISPIKLEISKLTAQKVRLPSLHSAFGAVGAAFGDQEIDQLAHHVVVGVTDQRRGLAHLVTSPTTTSVLM